MTKHSAVSMVMLVLIFAIGLAALFAFPDAPVKTDQVKVMKIEPVAGPVEPKPVDNLQTLGIHDDKPFPINTSWRWARTVEVGGGTKKAYVATPFEITFDGAGRFQVKGDCNSIGGQYVVWGPGDASLDNIMMTEMYCEGSKEAEFVSTLSRTTAYEVEGDTLTLTIEGDIAGYEYMIFTKI